MATATLGGQQGAAATVKYNEVDVSCNDLIDSTSRSWVETDYYYSPDNGANYYRLFAKRTGNNTRIFTWGYSTTDSSDDVTEIDTQSVYSYLVSYTEPNITVYSKSGTEAVPAYTTVSFKGVTAGTTTAVVGTTQYNIHVYETVNITINYKAGGTTVATSTLTVASDDTAVTLPKQVTGNDGKIYAVDKTTLTLTDATSYNVKVSETKAVNVTVENTPFTGHTGAEGVGKKISNLIIGTGTTYDLNVKGDVVWGTTSDKITVDQNGVVTGVTATGDDETVYVTATVNGVIYQLPVTVLDVRTSGSTRTIDFYSQEVLNCTAYYSYQGNDLVEFPEGSEFYVVHSSAQTDIVSFFATPDPGYAVTYANGTRGTYFHVVKNADGTSFGYESSGNSCNHSLQMKDGGYNYAHDQLIAYVINNGGNHALTADQVHAMLDNAVAKNCDAMFFFSRGANTGSMNSSTTFIAEKLPTFDKTVDGVLPASGKQADYRRYVPGMVATVGEMVYFKITVTLEKPLTWQNEATGVGPINYTNALVKDTFLKGAYLYTKELDQKDGKWDGIVDEAYRVQKDDITAKLNAAWAADETQRTIELYLVYTVTQGDIANNTLFNTADLSYTYQSHYSKGASTQEADATASIDMMGALMGSIVIDFGLPVTYTASAAELSGATRGSAKYGSVEVDPQNDGSYLVTYTPNQILPAVDTVSLYNEKNELINAFQVLPATTVYYEEGFLFTDPSKKIGNWTGTDNKGRGTQAAVVLGHAGTNNFGYDSYYAGTTTNPMKGSDGTWAMSDAVGDTTSFTFTGTGFQLYANSETGSGIVSVYSKGGIQRIYTIDTGLTVPPVDQNGNAISPNSVEDVPAVDTFYSLPVVSETSLPFGTYVVTIRHTKDSKPIYLDGVRIFNTLQNSTVFTSDLEDKPVFHELRDHLLKDIIDIIGVDKLTSDYVDGNEENGNRDYDGKRDAVADMAGQIYNAGIDGGAVVINMEGETFDAKEAQDLLDNGPKNELYLYPGQTLVFSVTTNRVMQLGLKSPIGHAEFTITVDGAELDLKSLSTTVDMFYKIADKTTTEQKHTVRITVTKDTPSVLSVTTLKVCDDPNFSFNTLTQEDIENALLGIYGLDKVENPFEDVVEDDFFFDAVLWAHENGITNGMDDTHFIPTGMCNRAQIVTFLWRAMGKPAPTTTVNPFVDVTESDFFYDAVLWAHENGITNGVDATHFNPTGECNRAQAVTFLWRAVGEPESTADVDFTDVQPGQFYSAAVAWAFEKGITNGMGDGTFGVLESCNRAQVVTFLYRALAPR